ncbi:MAG: hypothetical protein HOP33_13520 [Verrucomicrobia bacterium]|nr:hypothetical protein [Verrucomicrobiota bacterium]
MALLIAGLALITTDLQAQTDNFDTGTDAGWSKITSPDYPATYSFPTDVFGGKAYRLQGGAAAALTARVLAYRADRLYTNFYVAADIVSWDAGYTNGQVFGLVARASNIDSGLLDAVTFTVRINHVRDSAGSRGRAQIYGFSAGGVGAFVAQDFCTLVSGRKYRFVFSGTNNILTGSIFDLEDLTRPLTSMTGDDAAANSGFAGPPLPDPNAGGYSGIFNLSLDGTDPTTDTTFDNFVASELPPTSVTSPAAPHGMLGIPQVVNRSPASFANFSLAANGISFHASTLTTTNAINTNAIRLYLNNVDVSSGLSITGPTTNAAVSYHGLSSNVVYEAHIELQDALGRKTTNRWTFDTFSDAYLASAHAKNIECEDFDFDGGHFIDDPLPSGYATNDITHSSPINGSGVGYLDLDGTAGVDFFDYDGSPKTDEHDFRFFDSVGTQLGIIAGYYSDGNDPVITPFKHVFDTQRQKYLNADPALLDYVVERTEGGEWLNYTRIFTNSSYYNVYLRYNSGLDQPLVLGVLPSTNNLGMFIVKGSCTLGNNYRYAPLLDVTGKLAVLSLSGTNTIRLTMAAPQSNITKHTTALNYMAFVPALLVESAAQVNGPYTIEPSAIVEPGSRHVTLAAVGNTRFYRLRWDHAVSIKSINLVGGNVELTYQ